MPKKLWGSKLCFWIQMWIQSLRGKFNTTGLQLFPLQSSEAQQMLGQGPRHMTPFGGADTAVKCRSPTQAKPQRYSQR